jgi:heme-degrading monooxygenase HmoA
MTQAVLFDVLPKPGHVDQYFEMAAQLKPIVQQNPGFLSVERFANLLLERRRITSAMALPA